jgi:catechol 2,3-dioxygenase-like lactoylglutathione lyase family enzyme
MTKPTTPQVDCEHHHTGLPVSDALAAADFYTKKLGVEQAFTWGDPPAMAGVNLGRVQIFLEQGTPNPKKKFSFTPASLSATALPARIPKEPSTTFKNSN